MDSQKCILNIYLNSKEKEMSPKTMALEEDVFIEKKKKQEPKTKCHPCNYSPRGIF